jgi:acetoin utilization protein AcuB
MSEPTVEQFMTHAPHTIGHHQPMATAHQIMREFGIRHLSVLDSGKLVGIVSQRDLHLMETLRDVDPEEVKVSEAMSEDAYAIGPRSSVRKVAAEMADHKYGCAVVIDKDCVIGVFTTVDALRALSELLEEQRQRSSRPHSEGDKRRV